MDHGKKLLIIDDEVDVCLLLKRILSRRFATIETAFALAEGLEKASTFQPDVILLDNNLPDGYGIEHIETFKNSIKSVQLVMISAMDIRAEALAAGADNFMGKPIILADLPW